MVLGSQYIWGNISIYCLSHFFLIDKDNNENKENSIKPFKKIASLGLPLIVISSTVMMPIGS